MAMIAGSVVVEPDGTVSTSTGMAGAMFDQLVGGFEADTGVPMPEGAAGAAIKRNYRHLCVRMAVGMVNYIQSNSELRIGTGDSGLQRADVGGVPNSATLAPSSTVIAGSVT